MKNTDTKVNRAIKCAQCFKLVSVPSRMVIYNYLNQTPKAMVGDIVEKVGLTQPTVSYHLKEMKDSGLLKSNRVGKKVYYSINTGCPHTNKSCVLSGIDFS